MLTAISSDERLVFAAETAGLKRSRGGLFGAGKEKADWAIEIDPSGGLTLRRGCAHTACRSPRPLKAILRSTGASCRRWP